MTASDRFCSDPIVPSDDFCKRSTDDALDVLELLVKDLLSCSAREGKKERLRTLKDLDAAALQLSQVGRVLLDPNCDDEKVREKV